MGTNELVQRRPLIAKEISALQQRTKQELIDEILTLREKILRANFSSSHVLRDSRSEGNRLALEAWRLLQYQEEAIRRLARERDVTMDFLSARLLFVESRLRQEQKNIEALMDRKERIIEEQRRQINYLQQRLLLTECQQQSPSDAPSQQRRDPRQSRRRLSRRFSLALEECDGGTKMSRASPCYASSDEAQDNNKTAKPIDAANDGAIIRRQHPGRRVRSMMELNSLAQDDTDDKCVHRWPSHDRITKIWIENPPPPPRQDSDESSRNSDSLDSGVSAAESDEFETRSDGNLFLGRQGTTATDYCNDYSKNFTLPRSRKSFDEYSATKSYVNAYIDAEGGSDIASNKHSKRSSTTAEQPRNHKQHHEMNEQRGFNRCFGTNHRSVTKPKDIKYRKLWKIRRVVSNVS